MCGQGRIQDLVQGTRPLFGVDLTSAEESNPLQSKNFTPAVCGKREQNTILGVCVCVCVGGGGVSGAWIPRVPNSNAQFVGFPPSGSTAAGASA